MFVIPHRRFGKLIPNLFFVEHVEQVPQMPVFFLSRSFLEPKRLEPRGYVPVRAEWSRTLLTDLRLPIEHIRGGFRKDTKERLRRAERLVEGGDWCVVGPSAHTEEDSLLIARFRQRKQLDASEVDILEMAQTRPYWRSARAYFKGGLVLVRTYLDDAEGGIVRCLFTGRVSDEAISEADLGCMNRLLHWVGIRFFHEQGYRIYDWGGISKHGELAGIDSFKRSFGGSPAIIWDALICKKPLAPVLRAIWKLRFGKPPEVEEYHEDASEETQDAV